MPRLKRKSQEQLRREAKQRMSDLRDIESEEDTIKRKERDTFNVSIILLPLSLKYDKIKIYLKKSKYYTFLF